jgi:hypothetical protein
MGAEYLRAPFPSPDNTGKELRLERIPLETAMKELRGRDMRNLPSAAD